MPLYLEEPASAAAQEALARDFGQLVTSVLAPVEAQAALARFQREGVLSAAQSERVAARLRADLDLAPRSLELNREVLGEALRLLKIVQTPIRTLDVLHVASCLRYGTKGFVTADKQQARFAQAVGLEVSYLE